MMRSSVVLAAMLCAAATAFAQAPASSAAHPDWQARRQQWEQKWNEERTQMEQQRLDRLAVLLDMTPAQKRQVRAILTAERARRQQAMKQAMEARRAAHTETITRLGQVLSPAQMKKLKLLMPQRHRRFFMGRGPMGMPGPMWHPDHGAAPPPPPPAGPGPQ